MTALGWSYPAGCSGPPEDDYPDYPPRYHCPICKRFVSEKTFKTYSVVANDINMYGEEEAYFIGTRIVAECKRCGKVDLGVF